MSSRINIKCGTCAQILAVDPAAAGQQVRCPKCQSLLVIPATAATSTPKPTPQPKPTPKPQPQRQPKTPAPAAPRPQATATTPAAKKITVSCSACGTKMMVGQLAQPAIAACPGCQNKIRIPAATPSPQPTSSPSQPTSAPAAARRATAPTRPSPAAAKPATQAAPVQPSAPASPAAVTDLGALDLPTSPTAGGPLDRPTPRRRKASFSAGTVFSWINNHRWVTAIILLNLFPLVLAIFYPPVIMISAFNVPVGLVIIAFLFIPRQHIVKRVLDIGKDFFDAAGSQLAGAGLGGVLLVIVVVLARALPRLARKAQSNPNLDFSGFLDLSRMGPMLGTLATSLGAIAVGLFLWHLMGIARVMAAGYCAQLSFFSLLLLVGVFTGSIDRLDTGSSDSGVDIEYRGSASSAYEEHRRRVDERIAESRARAREAMERARERRNVPPLPGPPPGGSSDPSDPFASRDPNIARRSGLGATSASIEARINDRIDLFRHRNFNKQTVAIKVTRSNPADAFPDIRVALQKELGLRGSYGYQIFPDVALMQFVNEDPIADTTAKLKSGEVLNVDESNRIIEYRINALP